MASETSSGSQLCPTKTPLPVPPSASLQGCFHASLTITLFLHYTSSPLSALHCSRIKHRVERIEKKKKKDFQAHPSLWCRDFKVIKSLNHPFPHFHHSILPFSTSTKRRMYILLPFVHLPPQSLIQNTKQTFLVSHYFKLQFTKILPDLYPLHLQNIQAQCWTCN